VQDTVGGFLPAGKEQLDGWNWYLNFMLNLEAAVLRADPVPTSKSLRRLADALSTSGASIQWDSVGH
jgi:hypothetical protein